jgi:hypothetical protein
MSGSGRKTALGAVFILLAAAPAVAATVAEVNGRIDSVLGNSKRYETSINAFQHAVATGSKEDVAAFIRYPISVTVDGQKTVIRSPEAFVKQYDRIMTPDIVNAVKNQKYGDLFVNDQGVMFGDGQVWLDAVCLDRKCDQSVIQVITLQEAPAS